MPYVKTKEACKHFGVHPDTVRKWAKEGRIEYTRVGVGGQRLYNLESFNTRIEPIQKVCETKKKFIYCRVSTSKQKDDLERQVEYLKEKYPTHEVIKEIASGINFKRKGLNRLLDQCLEGMVSEVVVAHKDRLCRISFEHFNWLFDKFGVRLIVDCEDSKSTETELANDLMSIVHVFSSRHYGERRKYTTKRSQECNEEKTTETNQYESCQEN